MNDRNILEAPSSPESSKRSAFWAETGTTCLLALPIIGGQIIQNSLSVIDTLMVGRVSVEAVAAGSLATALFVVPLVFGFGMMGPFSVFVSGSFAREELTEAAHHLRRGLVLSFLLAVGLVVLITMFSAHQSFGSTSGCDFHGAGVPAAPVVVDRANVSFPDS